MDVILCAFHKDTAALIPMNPCLVVVHAREVVAGYL